ALRGRVAGGAAESMVRQGRERGGRTTRVPASRYDERASHARAVEAGPGEEGGLTAGAADRVTRKQLSAWARGATTASPPCRRASWPPRERPSPAPVESLPSR